MVEEAEAASAVLERVENLACWRTFAELLIPCGIFTTKPSAKGAADRTARRAEVVFILLGSVAVSFCFFFFVVHLLCFAAAGLFVVRVASIRFPIPRAAQRLHNFRQQRWPPLLRSGSPLAASGAPPPPDRRASLDQGGCPATHPMRSSACRLSRRYVLPVACNCRYVYGICYAKVPTREERCFFCAWAVAS